jgi:transposase
MGCGRATLDKAIPEVFGRIAERLPSALINTLREQWNGLAKLDEQIANIERRMREWKKEDKAVKAISEIPGVGLLTAPVAAAMMDDAKSFRSGREFAAWAGLVPKQTGTGGKVTLHGYCRVAGRGYPRPTGRAGSVASTRFKPLRRMRRCLSDGEPQHADRDGQDGQWRAHLEVAPEGVLRFHSLR